MHHCVRREAVFRQRKAPRGREQTEGVPENSGRTPRPVRMLLQEGYISRRQGRGWFPDLSPEPLLFTNARHFRFLSYSLTISLGNLLSIPRPHGQAGGG